MHPNGTSGRVQSVGARKVTAQLFRSASVTADGARCGSGGSSEVDPKFPRPLDMGPNLKLFDDDELNAYDDALRAARASDTSEGA